MISSASYSSASIYFLLKISNLNVFSSSSSILASCLIYHWIRQWCSFLFATRRVLYLKTNGVPACFSYVEQSQFFHSFRKIRFLKPLALISLLWTLSICLLSFLNCSTQIYRQHCSWIISTAKSSCQLLSRWRKLYLVTRTWYLALLTRRPVTHSPQQSLLEGEGLLSWFIDFR